MAKERIQKFLSRVGVASRRAAEEMVIEGRVLVNGAPVVELPCFVDDGDDVRVDGRRVRPKAAGHVYFLLNKPRGVVCTQSDPQGRPRARDLVPAGRRRVYCAGRLDADTTGLIVLSDDGELTQHLTHPSHEVPKTYVAEADGKVEGPAIERLRRGVWLDAGKTRPAGVKVLRRGPRRTLLELRLSEGRNREVRRILARLGHKVRRLKRTAIGPITDRGLKIGSQRPLRPAEVARLRKAGRWPAG